MNLNLGLESLVVVKQQPVVTELDVVLSLSDYMTRCDILSEMLTGYQNADAVLKLKKAGKLTSDMLELIGVENMQAIAAMEADTASSTGRWKLLVNAFKKVIAAFVGFMTNLYNRTKALLSGLINRIKTRKTQSIVISELCKKENKGADVWYTEMDMTAFKKDCDDVGAFVLKEVKKAISKNGEFVPGHKCEVTVERNDVVFSGAHYGEGENKIGTRIKLCDVSLTLDAASKQVSDYMDALKKLTDDHSKIGLNIAAQLDNANKDGDFTKPIRNITDWYCGIFSSIRTVTGFCNTNMTGLSGLVPNTIAEKK